MDDRIQPIAVAARSVARSAWRALPWAIIIACLIAVGFSDRIAAAAPQDCHTDRWDRIEIPHTGGREVVVDRCSIRGGGQDAIVALHPMWQTWRWWRTQGYLEDIVDRGDTTALIVYATSYPGTGSWNAGWCCAKADEWGVQDRDYLAKAAAHLTEVYQLNPRGLGLLGASNGGMMAQTAGAMDSDIWRAVASYDAVNVATGTGRFAGPHPPMLVRHAEDDRTVPYRGGWGGYPVDDEHFRSTYQSHELWDAWGGGHVHPYEIRIRPGGHLGNISYQGVLNSTRWVRWTPRNW